MVEELLSFLECAEKKPRFEVDLMWNSTVSTLVLVIGILTVGIVDVFAAVREREKKMWKVEVVEYVGGGWKFWGKGTREEEGRNFGRTSGKPVYSCAR